MKKHSKIFLVALVLCIVCASLFTSVFEAAHQLEHANLHTQSSLHCKTCVFSAGASSTFKFLALALVFTGIFTSGLLSCALFYLKNILNRFLYTPVALKVKITN